MEILDQVPLESMSRKQNLDRVPFPTELSNSIMIKQTLIGNNPITKSVLYWNLE